jgi:hypothetical protein
VVRRKVVLVRLIFNMIGDRYGIKAFSPRLLGSDVWPNTPVREDGVNMEVTLECLVALHVWDVDRCANPGVTSY